LGDVGLKQGDYAAAQTLYQQSLMLCREMGDKLLIAWNQAGLAAIAMRTGAARRAAYLAAAAETLLTAIHAVLEIDSRYLLEQTVAAARVALGEAAFAAAKEAGQNLTFDEAVALALQDTNE
jgi:hypothetical protein